MALYFAARSKSPFWAIERRENGVFSATGKAGATGRSSYRLCSDAAEAAREVERRVEAKTLAGYELVDPAFSVGDRFPGSGTPSAMSEARALERLQALAARKDLETLREVVRAFCEVWKPRLRARARYWTFAFERGPDHTVVRLARQFAPLGAPDNVDEHERLGLRIEVDASRVSADAVSDVTSDFSEGASAKALLAMLEGSPYDALRDQPVLGLTAFHEPRHG